MGLLNKRRAMVQSGMKTVKCTLCPNRMHINTASRSGCCTECFQLSDRHAKYQHEKASGRPITVYDKTALEETGDK